MSGAKRPAHERTAQEKMRLITPLLVPGMEHKQIVNVMKEIEAREDVSYRSLARYLAAWEEKGYEGLQAKPAWNKGKTDTVPGMDQALEYAIALRIECPTRSVKDIIRIMEMERKIEPNSIRRQTLQDHLQAAGYSAKRMRSGVVTKGKASRRFQKSHRNELWQSDIKYGPYLPIGEKGEMKQAYLCVFIDDCTRFIVSAAFYEAQDTVMVEDCFRKGIMQYGKPDMLYVDNGSQYASEWIKRACEKLKIVLRHTKPYDPEAKGKVEAFNRRMTAFLSEAALARPQTLDELNRHLENWINEYYHTSPHSSLGEISPRTAYNLDSRSLTLVDHEQLREAFLHVEERHADKTGCIKMFGKVWEVGMRFAKRTVEVIYDPQYKLELDVRIKGEYDCVRAQPLEIAPFVDYEKNTPVPPARTAPGSRLLDALNNQNITHRTHSGIATSFRAARQTDRSAQETTDHV